MLRRLEAESESQSGLYRAILEKIISAEYPSGYRLVEEELARAFNVSRTPVREVLFALQKDGLVERVRNRGARVIAFTADDVEELFEIRKALECSCIPRVVRTMKLNELLELDRRLGALGSKKGPALRAEQADIDFRLHDFIVSSSGNRRLVAYLDNLTLLLHSLRMVTYLQQDRGAKADRAAEDHRNIMGALLRRDVEEAQQLLAEHIERGKQDALDLFIQPNQLRKGPAVAEAAPRI